MAKTQLKKKAATLTTKKTAKKAAKPAKTAKKTVAKKAPAKKVAVKKAVAKKPVAKKTVAKKAPAKKVAAKKVAPKKVATKAPARGTTKVMVSKAKSPKANVQVKKAVAPQKLAPQSQVKSVDRKTGPVTIIEKPLATRPTLVTNQVTKIPAPTKGASKGFAVGEYVVYPTHGVGKIIALEVETIGEHQLKVFVIVFEKDKMTLRVPVGRAEAAGLRAISPMDQITRALSTLKGRAKIARGMWSRRAQEYESKINSGNLVSIAEVVRDLHKNVDQSERSYSERMIYETALHRLVGEVAAAERGDVQSTQDRLLKVLRKQAA